MILVYNGRVSTPTAHSGTGGPPEFRREGGRSDLTPVLVHLLHGGTLSVDQTVAAFEMIMSGAAHDAEIGAFLSLMATRTPTGEELLGAARVMRANVDAVRCSVPAGDIVDTAGTGGAPKTFNVSTAAAIIAAGAGAKVAKHGNRSRTGRGSAEVLERLGVNVNAARDVQARCLEQAGVCFCYAIHHHPATRHVMAARKALGFATIFNLLGPLTNPAGARRQVMGVYSAKFLRPVADALSALGTDRAMVVHSVDGLDELTVTAPTLIVHVEGGEVREEEINPEQLGLSRAARADLEARDLDHAAEIIERLLQGRLFGPLRDMALLNAAAAILVAGKSSSLGEGLKRAEEALDAGCANATLARLRVLSNAAS
jgi:anthranilate phosphoribosyltransferase